METLEAISKRASLKNCLSGREIGRERLIIFTPLAYPAQGSYEEAAKERQNQRTRKKLSEIAYINEWGKPF